MSSVLVAYATRHGSTADVAEAVAARLRGAGGRVDLVPAEDVRDLAGYDAVVVGGALYAGRWHRQARRFLHRHRAALADLPLAVFALGPRTLAEEDVAASRAQLQRALDAVPELHPQAVAIFGGVVDPARLPFPFSRMPATDARDWHAIDDWAESFSAELV